MRNNLNKTKTGTWSLWVSIFVLLIVMAGFLGGILAWMHIYPRWPALGLFGVLGLAGGLTWYLRTDSGKTGAASSMDNPDVASAEEQTEAFERMARMPHYCRQSDGALFDLVLGARIEYCDCGNGSPFHLLVNFGRGPRYKAPLVTRQRLAQFVALQEERAGLGYRARPRTPTEAYPGLVGRDG